MKKIISFLCLISLFFVFNSNAQIIGENHVPEPDFKYIGKTNFNGISFETICSNDYLVDVYLYTFKANIPESSNLLILLNNNNVDNQGDIILDKGKNIVITNANSDKFKDVCTFKEKPHEISALNLSYFEGIDLVTVNNLLFYSQSNIYNYLEVSIISNKDVNFSNNVIKNTEEVYVDIIAGENLVAKFNKILNNRESTNIFLTAVKNIAFMNNIIEGNENRYPDALVGVGLMEDSDEGTIVIDNNQFKNNHGILLYVDGLESNVIYHNNRFLNNTNPFKADMISIKSENIISNNNVFENNKTLKNLMSIKNINNAFYYNNKFLYNESNNDLYITQFKGRGNIFIDNNVNKILFNGNKKHVFSDQYIETESTTLASDISPIDNLKLKIDSILQKNNKKSVFQLSNMLGGIIGRFLPGGGNSSSNNNNNNSTQGIEDILSQLSGLNSNNNNQTNNQNTNNNNDSNESSSSNGGIFGSISTMFTNLFKPIINTVNNINNSIDFVTNSGESINPSNIDFDLGVSNSAKPIYNNYEIVIGNNNSREIRQLSKKEPDMFYRFSDTKLNTYANDYIVNIDIKNKSDKNVFFNKVLIKEYVGEPLSKPITTNENVNMFEEANKALIEYLQAVYAPLMDRAGGVPPNLGALLIGDEDKPSEGSTETDTSFLESLIETNLSNIQQTETPNLQQSNKDKESPKEDNTSNIWEGNFIISTENCQDPYYINEGKTSLLDIIPFTGDVFLIGAGKTCSIQIMFKPKDQAGYHMDTIEIGTATLPDPLTQAINNVFGSLKDINFNSMLASIFIKVDGYAYNEKKMLIDVDRDYRNDEVAIRYYDGKLSNPLYGENKDLINMLENVNSYTDETANLVEYLGNTAVAQSEIMDPHLSVLSDFDYYYLYPYFVDKYNNKSEKNRRFPKNFDPYYKIRFTVSDLKNSDNVKLVHTMSINPNSKVKVYYENVLNGTFRDVTENFNIYKTRSNSFVSPTITVMEFYVTDGGYLDADGITDNKLNINALWVGVDGKSLELGKNLLPPDISNLVPPKPKEEPIKWGGLPVND